ncbi:MAG: HDIG domain-containing protein [Candidatus Eisenbacteria bacterium]|nr:HDIG domain-containing protein [Candidatus Eisenbacteria bacterium]
MKVPKRNLFRRGSAKEQKPRLPLSVSQDEGLKKRLLLSQKLAVGLGFVIVAVLLFPPPSIAPKSEYREGAVSDKQIIAPFQFSILKPDAQYQAEKEEAAKTVLPVFAVDAQQTSICMARLAALRQAVQAHEAGQDAPLDISVLGDVRLSPETQSLLARRALGLDVVAKVEAFAVRTLEAGVVKSKRGVEIGGHGRVMIRGAKGETEIPVSSLRDKNSVLELARTDARREFSKNSVASSAFVELVSQLVDPNAEYDAVRTESERTEARNSVSPYEGVVLQGEKIIESHERITAEHLRKLRSLEYYRRGLDQGVRGLGRLLPYASRMAVVALFVLVFAWYLRVRRPKILSDAPMLLLIAIVAILVVALAAIVLNVLKQSPYLVPIAIVPFLITLLLGDELALLVSIITSVLVGALAGLDLTFLIVSLIAAVTGVFAVIGVTHRRQFYTAMLFVSMAYVVSILVGGFSSGMAGSVVVKSAAFGILNSFASTLIAIALLPVLESTFGLTTNITLLELSDLNRPILRKMMIEAPGTYHHSMVVGSLAEGAAEAIGANSLLARVASYYHDIGKITKPEYYIENQKDARSRHDRLTPSMSCLILESHVREGVEIAEREKLPRIIRQLIMEHHGTTLMAFFYQKALEIDSDAPIDEYRYPGPKPSSKEAAIIMLADSVEAASRSLSTPTSSRIHGIVKRIIENRATEGELDECGLTLAELAKIRGSFIPILTSIFHGRPSYPEDVKKKEDGDINSEQTEKDWHSF